MTPWEIIDAALKRRRPARNQQWLADQLGYKLQRVNNWRARGVPHKELRPCADVLGLSMEQIEGLAPLPWDRGWPFADIEPERYYSLHLKDKERVQRVVLQELARIERERQDGSESTGAEGGTRPATSRAGEATSEHHRIADTKRLPDVEDNGESKARKSHGKAK